MSVKVGNNRKLGKNTTRTGIFFVSHNIVFKWQNKNFDQDSDKVVFLSKHEQWGKNL